MMRYVAAFCLSIVFSQTLFAQAKINYTVSNGVHFQGVDQTNPVIYDNDMVFDTPEMFYLWLKANRKQLNLVGNISTKDGHPQGYTHDRTYKNWTDAYAAFKAIGGQNVPAPVRGSSRNLTYGQTTWENSTGSDLIITEARKASPSKPLVIIVGGQATSVANAFMKDRTIGPNIIVFHVDGWGQSRYNAIDKWACEVLLDNGIKYVDWTGDLNGWYVGAGYSASNKMPGVNLTGMPSNAFSNLFRSAWYNQAFQAWGHMSDGPPAFYFYDHSLWQNVQRKTKDNQNTTSDNFSYLLVAQNKWTAYGPLLSAMMVDPNSYIPASQPSNQPPSVSISSPANNASFTVASSITISANASDSDGSVQRVEFFHGSTKIGEDLSSPYSFVWNSVTPGTYSITAKATDNSGSVTTSAAVSITVKANTAPAVSIQSPEGNAIFTGGSNITITATASDSDGSVSKVEFFRGTTKLGEDTSSPFSFVWNDVPAGNYTLTAKATDNLGATATSGSISIIVTIPNTPPKVNITAPANDASFNANSSITLTANATDSNGNITKVEFFNGTSKLGEDTSAPYSFVWNNVASGDYTIIAKATDNENAVSSSPAINITVITVPVDPILPPNNPPVADAGEDITEELPIKNLTIKGTGTDMDGEIITYAWTQVSGPGELSLTQSNSGELHVGNLIAGTYVFELTVTDNHNLTHKDQVTVTVLEVPLSRNIPRYFTPNNDGINDTWEWPNIELYRNLPLVIFNRFGQKIYETESYQNNWNGTVNGKPLQEDAYYYNIKLDQTDIKGAVRIVR